MKGRRQIGGLRMGCGEGLMSRVLPMLLRACSHARRHLRKNGVRQPGGQR